MFVDSLHLLQLDHQCLIRSVQETGGFSELSSIVDDPNLQDIEDFSIFRGLKAEQEGGEEAEEVPGSAGAGPGERDDDPAETEMAAPDVLHSSQESLLNLNEDSISSMDIDIGALEKVPASPEKHTSCLSRNLHMLLMFTFAG